MVRQWLYRWTAFSFFACAAFAWVPPLVDRVGLAALGLGFLALSLGRAWGVARPGISAQANPAAGFDLSSLVSANDEALERAGSFGADGWR